MPDRPLTRDAREARDNISPIADSYVVTAIIAAAVIAGLLLFVGSAMFNTAAVNHAAWHSVARNDSTIAGARREQDALSWPEATCRKASWRAPAAKSA
jgi:hypothetical protein